MNKKQIELIKISLTLAGVLIFAGTAIAQLLLREALDFDNDGKADLVVFNANTNTMSVKKSSNGNLTSQQFGFSVYKGDFFAPGDYDADSKADFAVWRDSDRTWYQYKSNTGTLTTTQFGLPGDEPVARDYDGDGKTDIAVVRRVAPSPTPAVYPTPGQMVWYILRSTNGNIDSATFGYDTDFPVPGDYDGDGKFDMAVQRPGTMRAQTYFYAWLSGSSSLSVTNFGRGGDIAVPGDYDGDGKTDIAVVRDAVTSGQNLTWYILPSSTGSYYSFAWGLADEDKTAQADYDGDGKTDPTVWRSTTGTFWILKSTGGYSSTAFGTLGDFPVAGYDTH